MGGGKGPGIPLTPSTSLGLRDGKEVRGGDEELTIGQMVTADGWGNEERMSSIFLTK